MTTIPNTSTGARTTASFRWTTPALLRAALGGAWVTAALFLLAAGVGLERHRHAVQTIGRDAAPSIITAHRIRTSLARAHVEAALVLAGQAEAAAAYDDRRKEAADELVAAAENITYGDAERQPIRRLVEGYGRYGAAVARAQATAGPTAAAAFDVADHLYHDQMLADADALDRANRDVLDAAYADQRQAAAWGSGWTVVAAVALLGWLAGTQLWLTRKTRRLVNVPLAAASAVVAVAAVWLVSAMSASADDLRTAKADAFDSLSALWQARAVAVDGYAARVAGGRTGRVVDDDVRLASPPPGVTLAAVVSEVGDGTVPAGFTGLLADELRNVTFPGERGAAVEAVRAAAAYEAVGDAASFARLDAAIGRTLDVNQTAFDANVAGGFAAVDGLWVVAAGAATATAVAAYLGLRPRLREYAG